MSPSGTMQRTSLQRLLCKYNLNYETFSMRSDKWRHRNRRRQILIRTFADQTEAKEKPPGSSSSPPLSVVLSVSSISGLVLLVLLVLLVKQCFYRKPKVTLHRQTSTYYMTNNNQSDGAETLIQLQFAQQ
ncbi:hypothetical protein Q8A73_012558 [Channa argus]|nr:hypothetical protein Q8A73_012558 [Channa argus]